MTEYNIEEQFVRWCKKHNVLQYKLVALGIKGFPDRTVLLPHQRIIYIEFKQPGGTTSKQQDNVIGKLRARGMEVHVLDNSRDAINIVKKVMSETL